MTHDNLPSDFPPLAHLVNTPTNVGQAPTSFVGRDSELECIGKYFAQSRIVTLLGTAGIGKSRIAARYALDKLDEYPSGVWIVDASVVTGSIDSRLADILGARAGGSGASDYIADRIGDGNTLVVLDNCETALDDCRFLIDGLISRCPNLAILVTSREPTDAAGEFLAPIRPLALPKANVTSAQRMAQTSPAVRLFVDRATAQSPSFRLDDSNCGAVADICRRLDGIPLAIELIAPKVRMVSPAELLQRMGSRPSGGRRSGRDAMRDAIEWSYSTLPSISQTVLARLTVFKGGWTLDAAENVCADDEIAADDILDEMGLLVDKSLVMVAEQEDPRRFSILRCIADYLGEAVGQPSAEILRAHATYYLDLVCHLVSTTGPGDEPLLFDRLEIDNANIHGALDELVKAERTDDALQMASALWQWWIIRGHLKAGWERISSVLTLAGERRDGIAPVLMAAGLIASELGEYAAAQSRLSNAVITFRETGPPPYLAAALGNLALVHQQQKQYTDAIDLYNECLGVYRQAGSDDGAAQVLGNLGLVLALTGRLDEGRRVLAESLELSRKRGMARSEAVALGNLSLVEIEGDSITEAARLSAECYALFSKLGDKAGQASAAQTLARIAYRRDELVSAARLSGYADQLRREIQIQLPDWEGATIAKLRNDLASTMVPEIYKGAVAEGAELTSEDVQAIATRL